jgi:hypothetical protein
VQDKIEQIRLSRFLKPRYHEKRTQRSNRRDRYLPLRGNPRSQAIDQRAFNLRAIERAFSSDFGCQRMDQNRPQLRVGVVEAKFSDRCIQGKRGPAQHADR